MAKNYFDRYCLYDSDKFVYSCNTEKGMIRHIRNIRKGFMLSNPSGGVCATPQNVMTDEDIRKLMYKSYGLGTLLVKKNWNLPHGICIKRNNDGTAEILRKVTEHENDGDYADYVVKEYVNLGKFACVDKAIDIWNDIYGQYGNDCDLWLYTNYDNSYSISMQVAKLKTKQQ